MNPDNEKELPTFLFILVSLVGLFYLLLSLVGIFVLIYELTKNNSDYLIAKIVSAPLSVQFERIGIFLQLLAGISIIPELIGETKLRESEMFLTDFYLQIRQIRQTNPFLYHKYEFGKLKRRFVVATSWLWVIFGMSGTIYLFFTSPPQGKIVVFFLGLIYLASSTITGHFMTAILIYIIRGITAWLVKMFPIKRLLSFVSFPLFLVGTLLQLVATFLA